MTTHQDSQDVKQNTSDLTNRDEMLSDSQYELERLYDEWFYKFAEEEPDGTCTLVIHEVHDGEAYDEFERLVKGYVQKAVTEARIEENRLAKEAVLGKGFTLHFDMREAELTKDNEASNGTA